MSEDFQRKTNFIESQFAAIIARVGSLHNKEIADLTDEEKTLICLCAGCQISTELTDALTYKLHTVNPVGFSKINGKIHVYERRN